ncbi:MAG: prolipoprotein diacylglyceryl transferase [Gammaproteobacteria bacterium]
MLTYPQIDPVAIDLGAVKIHWYGISYLVGIVAAWWLLRWRAAQPHSGWTAQQVSDLIFYCTIGLLLGGRLGSVLFYHLPYYLANPLDVFKIWQGGMSFHGGLLGVLVALWYFSRRERKAFLTVADYLVPVGPLGLFCGRIGNFINAELWGRPTDLPWGMVFPNAGPLARHPSQLYEALLEGVVLFVLLWWFSGRPRPHGAVSGLFLLGYGVFRFLVEFVREPDSHLSVLLGGWMTRGQLLSVPMILIGLLLCVCTFRGRRKNV